MRNKQPMRNDVTGKKRVCTCKGPIKTTVQRGYGENRLIVWYVIKHVSTLTNLNATRIVI